MLTSGLEEHTAAYQHLPSGKLAASCGWGNRRQGITTAEPRISLFVTLKQGSRAAPKRALTPSRACPAPRADPSLQGRRSRLWGPGCSAPCPSKLRTSVRGIRGSDPNVPREKRDCKVRRGAARGQVQRNCWCLERQSPLVGLAALSHQRQPRNSATATLTHSSAAAQQKLL